MPYVEQGNVMNALNNYSRYYNQGVTDPGETPIPVLNCPSDPRGNATTKLKTFYDAYYPGNNWTDLRIFAYTWYVSVAGISEADAYDWSMKPVRAGILSASMGANYQPAFSRVSDVTDGLSNTMMFGERPPAIALSDKCGDFMGIWYYSYNNTTCGAQGVEPANVPTDGGNSLPGQTPLGPNCPQVSLFGPTDLNHCCSLNHFGSFHTGGANFAFGDGSVRFISYSIANVALPPASQVPNGAQTLFEALSTRAGGEVADTSNY